MSWRPNAGVAMARKRAGLLDRARDFFGSRDVLEVTTPALVPRTATDPNIESIVAKFGGREVFLHTSPEYSMKRLLATGYPDIFQICAAYRDGEYGRHHLPEFTLLEWYRHGFQLREIMRESVDLVSALVAKKILQQTVYKTYAAAFGDALSLDPFTVSIDTLAGTQDADADLCNSIGDDRDAWLDLAMANSVAPTFATDRLTVVFHYPASQAALAQLCPDDERVADRFEVFLGPVELANGFVELTDPDEQERRFRHDCEKRRSAGKQAYDIDRNLIAALRVGMPSCAGVALGLDRLLMIDEGLDDIRDVTTFTPGADDET